MCYRGADYDFEKHLSDTTAKMKSYPFITDEEAHVMAMCLLVPRGWDTFLADEGISKRRSRKLLNSGAEKYRAGGGKDYWQG